MLNLLMSLDAAVVSTVTLIVGLTTWWQLRKQRNDEEKSAQGDIDGAIKSRHDVHPVLRDLLDYQHVNPKTGLTRAQHGIQQNKHGLDREYEGLLDDIEKGIEALQTHLASTSVNMVSTKRSGAETQAAMAFMANSEAAIAEFVALAKRAGRLDEDNRVTDTTGVSSTYKSVIEGNLEEYRVLLESDFIQRYPDLLEDQNRRLAEIEAKYEALKTQQETQGAAPSGQASPTPRHPALLHGAGVSVRDAISERQRKRLPAGNSSSEGESRRAKPPSPDPPGRRPGGPS